MYSVRLSHPTDLTGWREQSRLLLAHQIPPEQVLWSVAEQAEEDLLDRLSASSQDHGQPLPDLPPDIPTEGPPIRVPRAFLDLSEHLIRHHDPVRLPLLYRLLWRQTHGERTLMALPIDPDMQRASQMVRHVRSSVHHMRAYLRFRDVTDDEGAILLAWFEPEHHILELVAPFFSQRLGGLRWSILTPGQSAHWDGKALHYGPGQDRPPQQDDDALTACWKTYYASTFNPSRVNPDAMARQMPRRYWKNLDEAALIPELVRTAQARAQAMIDATPAIPSGRQGRRDIGGPAQPERPLDLSPDAQYDQLCGQMERCRACPLWDSATQIVFPEGPTDAALALVGDYPGDQDDLAGRPLMGAAGKVLDSVLRDAGLDRRALYVTLAVKHVTYNGEGSVANGGRGRTIRPPASADQDQCRDWLTQELAVVKPRLAVALGAVAAKALLGMEVTIAKMRGQIIESRDLRVLVTWSPDTIAQTTDPTQRQHMTEQLAADLALAQQDGQVSPTPEEDPAPQDQTALPDPSPDDAAA